MELRCRNGQITESMQNRQNNGLTLNIIKFIYPEVDFTMKFIYPAIFSKTTEGTLRGPFPDLECCTANRRDILTTALKNANQAAYDWIYVELD